jgi:cytochrome oxidase Cu insertion factor (SCO1/SenC/PrrC family)
MLARLLCSLILTVPLLASDPSMRVPDVQLTDQNGRQVHVHTDLMRGRTTAINFIFTSCTTICSPMGATFGRLQNLIDDKRVRLISVSIDPGTDTPERMTRWGARFDAGPSWSLLTGSREEVDKLRKAFGVYSADRFSHSPTVIVINDAGEWTRVNGIGSANEIAKSIQALTK